MTFGLETIMKTNGFLLILILSLVTTVFGKSYDNDEYGIHFTLPDHWEVIDFESLPLEKQQGLNRLYRPFKTLAICKLKDQSNLLLSQVIIQYRGFEKVTFSEAKKYIQSQDAEKRMITSAEINVSDVIGRDIKKYRLVETKCDFVKSANGLYGIVRYEGNDTLKVIGAEVKFLCIDGWVNLCCFSRGSEADRFVDTVNEIADSFQYDDNVLEGREISDEVSESSASDNYVRKQTFKAIWKWGGIILIISIVVGILKMLFFRD